MLRARRPELDGVRAVAITAVVTVHASAFLDPRTFPHVVPGGFLGVHVFFVLSGYLITQLLCQEHERTGGVRLGAFWKRRSRRLLPALSAVVAAHLAYAIVTGLSLRREVLWAAASLTGVSNLLYLAENKQTNRGLDQVWSLAVEAQFYLLWPPLLVWLLRRGAGRGVAALAPVALLVVSVGLSFLSWTGQPSWERVYFRSDVEAAPLLVGVLVALLEPRLRRLPALSTLGAGALGTLAVLFVVVHREDSWLYADGGLTGVGLLTGVLLLSLLTSGPLRAALGAAPVALLGRASYSLYLWHFPVFVAVYDLRLAPSAAIPLGLAVTAVLTWLSYTCVEQSALRRGRNRAAVRAQANATTSG